MKIFTLITNIVQALLIDLQPAFAQGCFTVIQKFSSNPFHGPASLLCLSVPVGWLQRPPLVKLPDNFGSEEGDRRTNQRKAGKNPRSKGMIDTDALVSNIFENARLSSFCPSPSDKALNL